MNNANDSGIHGLAEPDLYFETPEDFSRRGLVVLSVAAGVAAAAAVGGTVEAAELPVGETLVEITMPNGACDATVHPTTGARLS